LSVLKKLAGETVIYGGSSIIGRFLNWWLVPFYTRMFAPEQYGIVSNVYAYVAFLLILLTYGMETSFFRFAGKSKKPDEVYTTTLISLFVTSVSFVLAVFVFSGNIAAWMEYPGHPEYIRWMGLTVALDAFTSIPFARLRLNSRPVRFAIVKLTGIAVNIGLNIFLIYYCPKIIDTNPDSIFRYIYNPHIGIGYVFIANLISSAIMLVMLFPDFIGKKMVFDKSLLLQMLRYGWPLLIVGLAGMANQNIEKILMPKLLPESVDGLQQLGIYAANFKLAVLMNLFIQAFRYSFEPFFFSHYKGEDSKMTYALVMKYFVIFGLTIFLGVMLYLGIAKYFIGSRYYDGLKIVPFILMGYFFQGIFYTLSLWYKLTDKTSYGAKLALLGAVVTIGLNVLFIPALGYMASALAFLVASIVMTVASYFLGQKHFPVKYDLKRVALYFVVALILYFIGVNINVSNVVIHYVLRTIVILVFLGFVVFKEKRELKRLFV